MNNGTDIHEKRSKSKASKWKICKLKLLNNSNKEKPVKNGNDNFMLEKQISEVTLSCQPEVEKLVSRIERLTQGGSSNRIVIRTK